MTNIQELFHTKKIHKVSSLIKQGFKLFEISNAIRTGELITPKLHIGPIRNIVATPDSITDPDFHDAVIMEATNGIISHQSAAIRHLLIKNNENRIDLILPFTILGNGNKLDDALQVHAHRSLIQYDFEIGVDNRETNLGVIIQMTSKERTILDLLRNLKNNPEDYIHGFTALETYLENTDNYDELIDIATSFHFDISNELEQLTAHKLKM